MLSIIFIDQVTFVDVWTQELLIHVDVDGPLVTCNYAVDACPLGAMDIISSDSVSALNSSPLRAFDLISTTPVFNTLMMGILKDARAKLKTSTMADVVIEEGVV